MTLIIFISILSLLVLIHEFGHFITAKKSGVRVEEFGLGLPPRILGKKFGDTLYSLNWLPFGGFVKLTGEDDNGKPSDDKRSFSNKKASQRAVILVAGVCMNFILGISLYYVFLFSNGFKSFYLPMIFNYDFKFGREEKVNTVIAGYIDNSNAQKAGAELGDAILKIDDKPVFSVSDVRKAVSEKQGNSVTLLLTDLKKQDDSFHKTVEVMPILDEKGNFVLGVYLTESVRLNYNYGVAPLFSGFMHSYNVISYSLSTFSKILTESFRSKDLSTVSQSVSGPVGIYNIVGSILTYGGENTFMSLIDFVALMSLSLATINIMPFPALDGGRLIFVFIEMIRKKRLSPVLEMKFHKLGMAFWLGLLVLVTIKDIFM